MNRFIHVSQVACVASSLVLWTLSGCSSSEPSAPKPNPSCTDNDGDGYGTGCAAGDDCNDLDPAVHAGCQDCQDRDGDGFGIGSGCRGPDCNDNDVDVNPARQEVCGNGKDDDCNGRDDPCPQDCEDQDHDRYGRGRDCLGPDCDDSNANVNPGKQEVVGNGKDDDCNPNTRDERPVQCDDADGDGYGRGADCRGSDCNDNDPRVNPGAAEIPCNDRDDNCQNGTADECPQGKICDGSVSPAACRSDMGGPCNRTSDCAGDLLCDARKCLQPPGGDCDENAHCASPGLCDMRTHRCVGDICEALHCPEDRPCNRDLGRCVECQDHTDCPGLELCAGYACHPGTIADLQVRVGIKRMAQFTTRCSVTAPDDSTQLCFFVDASRIEDPIGEDDVVRWVCDEAVPGDFDPESDYEVARGLYGCGLLDDSEITWNVPIQPGSLWDVCIWATPRGWLGEQPVVVDDCTAFPAE